MKYLLDTHAVIWALENDARLGGDVREILQKCQRNELAISDMTLLEISILETKGRIRLKLPLKSYLLRIESAFKVLPISAEVASLSMTLPLPQADPFDRVIVATSLVHGLELFTRDQAITDSELVSVIW